MDCLCGGLLIFRADLWRCSHKMNWTSICAPSVPYASSDRSNLCPAFPVSFPQSIDNKIQVHQYTVLYTYYIQYICTISGNSTNYHTIIYLYYTYKRTTEHTSWVIFAVRNPILDYQGSITAHTWLVTSWQAAYKRTIKSHQRFGCSWDDSASDDEFNISFSAR